MQCSLKLACVIISAACAALFISPADAQLAPTGDHYAGRASDSGEWSNDVNASGVFSASIPLELPTAGGGLPIPLQITHNGERAGAAGQGWDIPLSFLQFNRSFAFRRPVTSPGVLPSPRERLRLSLLGKQFDLVRDGDVWVARSGSPQLVARQNGDQWLVYDGAGRTYTFAQAPGFQNTGLWLLKSIANSGTNRVELTYALTNTVVDGGTAIVVDLIQVSYNQHPALACFKHEVDLGYGQAATSPISLQVLGDKVLARKHVLTTLDVKSRADCTSPPRRLRRYEFAYLPDADTALPRLRSVRMLGQEGTAEATLAIPVASFAYGSATHDGVLEYRLSQSIALPPGVMLDQISGTRFDSSVNTPTGGPKYAMWQSLTDVTGDGRPDLIFKKNDKLWVAHNQAGPNSSTVIGANLPSITQLSDATLTGGAFSVHSTKKERFNYASANRNTTDTWRQAMDVNGDGRIDIIDAAEKPDRWVVYLNRGAGPTGVKWEKRSFNVLALRQTLTSRGHVISGNHVPLARRATGTNLKMYECWRWNGTEWVWYPQGFANHRCEGVAQQVVERGPERTFVEWELTDLNGDGYPDFVFDSTPVDFQTDLPGPEVHPVVGSVWPLDFGVGGPLWRMFQPRTGGIRAALNVRGVRFDVDQNVFAQSFDLGVRETPAIGMGVSEWRCANTQAIDTNCDQSKLTQYVAIADVNGDGIVDRVNGSGAYLGAFHGTALSFSPIFIKLPGPFASNVNTHAAECASSGSHKPTADQTRGLRDLTGDGIPDYVDGSKVWIGTGAGFRSPVPISVPGGTFRFSHETETCDGKISNTDGGLFDIDGDGRPDIIGLAGNTYRVSQLVGGLGGPASAGRLTSIGNGYGALTTIGYVSAKQFTSNLVPFPEIVATSVITARASNPSQLLSGVRYAYDRASLVHDAVSDRFVFPGYLRSVAISLFDGPPIGDPHDHRVLGAATVTDKWPLTPFSIGSSKQDRWLRLQRAGQPQDVYTLRGTALTDPWSFIGIEPSDTRIIGATHYEWGARLIEASQSASSNVLNCIEMADPLDFAFSFTAAFGASLDTCRAHGFVFGTVMKAYRGASPPPSSNNVQMQMRVLAVDDFGRVRSVQYDGDRFRSDDDVCVETSYATPTASYPRYLAAVASERVTDCKQRSTYAMQSWHYDGVGAGFVSKGHPTGHFVERRATDNGQLLNTIHRYSSAYDSAGNLVSVTSERAGAIRSATFAYDPFGLVLIQTQRDATGVLTTTSSMVLDPLTLDALSQTDTNGTRYGSDYDGFGRLIRSTVTPPGGQTGVRSTITYSGFAEGDPSGRQIALKGFGDAVTPAEAAAIPARTTTVYLDELARQQRTEVELGSDYGNGILMLGPIFYDMLGRVAFKADVHLSTASPATIYGTTYYYKVDGEPACFIRGFGLQSLSDVVDIAQQRFPTCFNRTLSDHVDMIEVRDPASLQASSPQSGVVSRFVKSAIGRPLERATVKGGAYLDRMLYAYDRLGQVTSLTRYADPQNLGGPVLWGWRMDSIGQVMRASAPAIADQYYDYSDWGELTKIYWTEGAVTRSLVRSFDARGRLIAAEEQNDGVTDPDSLNSYSYDVAAASPRLSPTFVAGRLTKASAASGDVTFSYDAFGNIDAKLYSDRVGTAYLQRNHYHADQRLAAIDLELPDTNYQLERVKYAYDSADRLRTIDYGSPTGTIELYKAEAIDPLGRVRKSHHGAASYSAHYGGPGRDLLTEAAVVSPQGARRWLYLGYDADGRELVRREIANSNGSGIKTNTGYDALGRIAASYRTAGPAVLGSRAIQYDALGNITSYSDNAGSMGAAMSFSPGAPDELCRVGYGSGLGGSACNVVEDAMGNVVTEPTRGGLREIRYFNNGLVRSITQQGATARFAYDPFGEVRELDISSPDPQAVRREIRLGDLIERREEAAGSGAAPTILRHVPGPGGTVATRHGYDGGWIFEFGEQRGNRLFADEAGEFVQDVDYEPFGEAGSTGAAPTSAHHTSYQWNFGDHLAAFGLVQVGARIYDPVIGRFLSRDPILLPRSSSLSNPYAFAMNDPLNLSDPAGLQPPEENHWWTPLTPFGGSGASGSGTGSGGQPGPQSTPAPDLWDAPAHKSGDPAIADTFGRRRLELTIAVALGSMTNRQASKAFQDFVRKQIYTNQHELGGAGFCACASKQMLLKAGGAIDLGLSYKAIKQGLRSETSSNASRPGQWEYWHFNETAKSNGRPVFSDPTKLGTDAIAQIQRNAAVGTGSTDRLKIVPLTASEARDFLDRGALVVVGTSLHWLTVVRDPFSGNYIYLDPYAKSRSDELLTSKSITEAPTWGGIWDYDALVHE